MDGYRILILLQDGCNDFAVDEFIVRIGMCT